MKLQFLSLRKISMAFLIISLGISYSSTVLANDDLLKKSLWKNVEKFAQIKQQIPTQSLKSPLKARLLELDEANLNSLFTTVDDSISLPFSAKNVLSNNYKTMTLPLPDGSEVLVQMTPNSVMSEALARQFPQIKTWDVRGVSEKVKGTIDMTKNGFHAMLEMPDGDRVFIEPDSVNKTTNQSNLSAKGQYLSFSKKDNIDNFQSEFSCGAHDHGDDLSFAQRGVVLARPSSDSITYRLAVATTGEYSRFHGGTVERALGAVVTTINRVNTIFERDTSIRFELVDEQRDLIYLNPNTDPYTNSDVFALIDENNDNLSENGVLSKTQYDIGHVFGQGNVGGLAVVGGVCNDNQKAFGATGLSSPIGDSFALDFVAHELGHQLGGTHTFNSNCVASNQRNATTAVEPGSGTTIMAYPGICPPNNIQQDVDPQFHTVSINQIRALTRTGGGSSCGVRTPTINENPTINAGLNAGVPARTPLVFVAEGADTDNDQLTYSWEQTDSGTVSDLNVDTGDNALFRSRPLTTSNVRYIPTLADMFAGTISDGELLPITNRGIEMVATVRDGEGGLQADLINLQVSDSGSAFRVTSHASSQGFGRGAETVLQWDVADTNLAPISCSSVDIGLVTVDGAVRDIITTANDGTETITIPSDAPPIADARFIVSCNAGNFFNLSRGSITVLDQDGGSTAADGDGGGTFEDYLAFAEGSNTSTNNNTNLTSSDASGNNGGSGGGGSMSIFMLLWGLALMLLRKLSFSFINVFKPINKTSKLALIGLPFLVLMQACSADANSATNTGISAKNIDSSMPKEFGNRFSIETIKKEKEAFYAQKLQELRRKNPATEVSNAVRSNNVHFLAVNAGRGSGFSIPGLIEPQIHTVNCRTKSVGGMGDVLYGKNHITYRKEMLQYMRKFNTLMESFCR